MLAGYGALVAHAAADRVRHDAGRRCSRLRFADRLGKGIRTSPRDAMLASFAPADKRGRVYGFHRAMDHAGAVTGPLLASAYLYFYPEAYRSLFVLDARSRDHRRPDPAPRPGARRDRTFSTVSTSTFSTSSAAPFAPPAPPAPHLSTASTLSTISTTASVRSRRLFLFSLGNASDAFLLLRLGDLGVAAVWIPLLWSALHVVKMTSSVVGGALSDRLGRRALIATGWLWYALVYAAFGWFDRVSTIVMRLSRLRPVFRTHRRRREGVDCRSRAGWRARHCVWVLQRGDRPRQPGRQPVVRSVLDPRVAPRGLLHWRRARARRKRPVILPLFTCRRFSSPTMTASARTACTCSPTRLRGIGDVTVVAPHIEASAIGHALTLRRPLRMEQVREGVYEVDGTPTDCVNIAVTKLFERPAGSDRVGHQQGVQPRRRCDVFGDGGGCDGRRAAGNSERGGLTGAIARQL